MTITADFTDQATADISDAILVTSQAMIGAKIEGDEYLTVHREILGGTYEPLRVNGRTVQLSKYNNEICLQGPKNYKLELQEDPASPISAWHEE